MSRPFISARAFAGFVCGLAVLVGLACTPPADRSRAETPGGTAATGTSAIASPAAARPAAELRPVKIQVTGGKVINWAHMYVPLALGIFEKHGLDVEIVAMQGAVGIAAL